MDAAFVLAKIPSGRSIVPSGPTKDLHRLYIIPKALPQGEWPYGKVWQPTWQVLKAAGGEWNTFSVKASAAHALVQQNAWPTPAEFSAHPSSVDLRREGHSKAALKGMGEEEIDTELTRVKRSLMPLALSVATGVMEQFDQDEGISVEVSVTNKSASSAKPVPHLRAVRTSASLNISLDIGVKTATFESVPTQQAIFLAMYAKLPNSTNFPGIIYPSSTNVDEYCLKTTANEEQFELELTSAGVAVREHISRTATRLAVVAALQEEEEGDWVAVQQSDGYWRIERADLEKLKGAGVTYKTAPDTRPANSNSSANRATKRQRR